MLTEQLIRTIRTRVVTHPQLLPLLDKLLDVSRSAWPHMKLLVALAGSVRATKTSTTAAAPPKPQIQPAEKPQEVAPEPTPPLVKKNVTAAAVEPVASTTTTTITSDEMDFPLTDFLAAMRKQSIGAATLLARCGYSYSKNHLTIYAGKPFTKKQIEKSLVQIAASLQEVGIKDYADIAILAKTKPARDSKTAAVLVLGKEQVVL